MLANPPDLRSAIADALHQNSANILPAVCQRYGLPAGTRDEAFSSKRTYVRNRIEPLPTLEVVEIARKVLKDFPTNELGAALQYATMEQPADLAIATVMATFDEAGVHAVWTRALERRQRDPEGAITLARTLLETVCKHIIDDFPNATYDDHTELPKLYFTAASCLKLAPSQYQEESFKRILSGCQNIVDSLATVRNKLGDAHGRGRNPSRPVPRHAALAVNVAGAMATFLVETFNERKRHPDPS